jgi:hypothetical protein
MMNQIQILRSHFLTWSEADREDDSCLGTPWRSHTNRGLMSGRSELDAAKWTFRSGLMGNYQSDVHVPTPLHMRASSACICGHERRQHSNYWGEAREGSLERAILCAMDCFRVKYMGRGLQPLPMMDLMNRVAAHVQG